MQEIVSSDLPVSVVLVLDSSEYAGRSHWRTQRRRRGCCWIIYALAMKHRG
ncbi:MAG: hypothetical protein U0528_14155 [Anaerolineae bacterium]